MATSGSWGLRRDPHADEGSPPSVGRRHRSVARAAGELGVTRLGLSKLTARLDIDRFNALDGGGSTFRVCWPVAEWRLSSAAAVVLGEFRLPDER